jgi:hypothetical protein
MAKVTFRYSKTTPPERKRALRELAGRLDVNGSLEDLVQEMKRYEKKFGMSTVEFYAKYLNGEMGDSSQVMQWAMVYQAYTHLIETSFVPKAASR